MNRENFRKSNYNDDMNRRMMERDDMFNIQCREDKYDPDNDNSNYSRLKQNLKGEITGESFDVDQYDTGMPLRTPSNGLISSKSKKSKSSNQYLDFQLYDEKPHIDVSYYDPSKVGCTNNYSNFSQLNSSNTETIISRKNREPQITKLNDLSNRFFRTFSTYLKNTKEAIISPFNVLCLLLLLYTGSSGRTENDFEKFFMPYNGKSFIINSIRTIDKRLKLNNVPLCGKYTVTNMLCVPKNIIEINDILIRSNFGDFFNIYRYHNNQGSQVATELNGYFKKIVVNQRMFDNQMLVLISKVDINFHPKLPFYDGICTFISFKGKRNIVTLNQENVIHSYYEDNNKRILEIEDDTGTMGLGFILFKKSYIDPYIDTEILTHLKPTIIQKVTIPKLNYENNYQMTNILKKFNLGSLLESININEFIMAKYNNNSVKISHLVHYCSIKIHSSQLKSNLVYKPSNINFIVNHQCMYYVKLKNPDILLSIGQYC